ncbi:Probable serine/threonine-protein kinase CST [Linum perenne]
MGNCLDSCFKSSVAPSSSSTFTNSSVQDRSYATATTTTADFSSTTATTTITSIASSAGATAAGSHQFSDSSYEVDSETPMLSSGQILEWANLKVFTLTDLKSATKNFKSDTLLGEGGFGKVYKGWVDEQTLSPSKPGIGMVVAIKKLNDESLQGFQEWQAEINFLGRLSHPNLVKLLGYCWEDKDLLLVYEFLEKGSLENHLFRRNARAEPLPWDLRLKIAIGAARGLAFLHASEKQIIYRDFKASNILLDSVSSLLTYALTVISSPSFQLSIVHWSVLAAVFNSQKFNAKISDFGLAKLGPAGGYSHVTTRVMGTYGYAAPEYIATGHLYVKSDVYGFGVVLLELLTGLRALDTSRPNGEQNLAEWLKPTLARKRKVKNIMDVRIEGQYSSKAMLQATEITLKCLEEDPKSRPCMEEVVEALQQIHAIVHKPKAAVSSSSTTSSTSGSSHSTAHRLPKPPINHHRYSSVR